MNFFRLPSRLLRCRSAEGFLARNLLLEEEALHRCVRNRNAIYGCVVGAGPSGMYLTRSLLQKHPGIEIDILEKLPMPGGLIRHGVAPDHPEMRNVMHEFDQNRDVKMDRLREWYRFVVLAYGSSVSRKLDVPGEHLEGVIPGMQFVYWYNDHPEGLNVCPRLDSPTENAVIIGNGNVALDIARILAKKPEELSQTDISSHALVALSQSTVKNVQVIGRRGVAQASFTNKELRELISIPGVLSVVDPMDYERSMTDASLEEIRGSRAKKRALPIYKKMMDNWEKRDSLQDEKTKLLHIRFLKSPTSFYANGSEPWRLSGIKIAQNRLGENQAAIQEEDSEEECIPTEIVVTSVGFYPELIPELKTCSSSKGMVQHTKGLVERPFTSPVQTIAGIYVSGWLKRGPAGIIASNISDSIETATTIVENLKKTEVVTLGHKTLGREGLVEFLVDDLVEPRRIVTHYDYFDIKEEEEERGRLEGRPLVRFTRPTEAIQYLDKLFRQRQKNSTDHNKQQNNPLLSLFSSSAQIALPPVSARSPEGVAAATKEKSLQHAEALLTSGRESDIIPSMPYNPSSLDGKDGILLPIDYREFTVRMRSEKLYVGFLVFSLLAYLYLVGYSQPWGWGDEDEPEDLD